VAEFMDRATGLEANTGVLKPHRRVGVSFWFCDAGQQLDGRCAQTAYRLDVHSTPAAT
jgi:hypothetical protein